MLVRFLVLYVCVIFTHQTSEGTKWKEANTISFVLSQVGKLASSTIKTTCFPCEGQSTTSGNATISTHAVTEIAFGIQFGCKGMKWSVLLNSELVF